MTHAAVRPRYHESISMNARRENAESLLRGIDALTRKFAALGPLPLDVLDRAERIAVAFHVSNLERVSRVSAEALAALEVEP